jgi:hypothetical protein
MIDAHGIRMLAPTAGREWHSAWDAGDPRVYVDRGGPADPGLALANGHHRIEVIGASGPRAGQMRVVGEHPRIYVRDSESFAVPPPIADDRRWGDVEVTFYALSTGASAVPWAGIAAAVKTNHWPDDWQCASGGYVARMLFDGRVDFVKELYHVPNTTFRRGAVTDAWRPEHGSVDGRLPLGRWIGFKLLARNDGPHVRLELYRDLSLGREPDPDPPADGGDWEPVASCIDDGTWSSGDPCIPRDTALDAEYGDASRPFTWPNYSVYLRTDGLGEDIPQYYKWFSVREVAALG